MTTELCRECGEELNKYLLFYCEECKTRLHNEIIKSVKDSSKENNKKFNENSKKYYHNNKEKSAEYQKKYRKKNKEKINKKIREKYNSNPNVRLASNLRKGIRQALKGKHKSEHSIVLLGCTIGEFKRHLESQFEWDMTWKNYGYYGWHVDHIIPCASFDLDDPDEQLKCFNYKNLQPMWAEDNFRKGSRVHNKGKYA